MPTTYTNGLKLPDLGSIDWYSAYKNNIDILDPIVGTVNGVATTYAPISHNHSASEITSGTIDIARLPPAALERMHIVADQTARYALTTSTVQEGDTVKQTDTGVMYLVVDSTKLDNADGYTEYSAGTASKAIADEDGTSIKTGYVNVAGNQIVTGDKSFTGSNTFNNILPNTTNTYSLGSSTNQWSSVYAQTYYYNGTAWGLDKENVWTRNQTIASGSGDQCYYVKDTVYELGQTYSNGEHLGGLTIHDKNGATVGLLDIVDRSYGNTEMRIRVQQKFDPDSNNRSPSGTTLFNELIIGIAPNKTNYIGFNADLWGANHNLGTSTNKWKTLNGVNPGALSFPEGTASNANTTFNPDLTDWLTDGTGFTITAQVTGWLHIRIQNSTGNFAWVKRASAGSNQTWGIVGNSDTNSDIVDIPLNVPVVQGYVYTLKLKTSRVSAAIFMCLGNV